MNIYIDSYSTIYQRGGGGVPMRIARIQRGLSERSHRSVLFNKWESKLDDADILHVFKANIDSYAEIRYAKDLGVKIVLSAVIPQEMNRRIRFGLLLKRLFKINNTYSFLKEELVSADAIIAQTQKEASFISKYYKIADNRIHIIPNGIDESIIESYDPTIVKDIVLCVGRFDQNKNQISLIKAMRGTNIPVHFVGGAVPDEKQYYEKCLEEAKGSDNFIFHGWLQQGSTELLQLFQRAKVCVLVSYNEIFGNAFVEGAAAGANLVVTKSLPIHEYGFPGGYYQVCPRNIDDIRESVIKAYYHDVPNSLREIAINKYSWKSVISKHIELYESLLQH